MREKKEILRACGLGSTEAQKRICELEVQIDIRDALNSIRKELNELNKE